MEKSLKLYLSLLITLVSISSCVNDTDLDKRTIAEKLYKDAIQHMQGSTAFQNGIAEAVNIDPTYQKAVYELSVADLKRGLPHKWLPQYNKAVKLNPKLRIPWRGYLYLWFYRDYKKAIADFDASDELTTYIDNPQGHSVDYWRGIAYLGLKDYKKSQAYFKKDIERQTKEFSEDYIDSSTFLYYGIALMETQNYDTALINLNKVLTYSNNTSSDAKYYKALIFKAQGELAKAKTEISNAIIDFNNGYYNQRAYVEALRQLYAQDFEQLKQSLN